MVRHHIVGALIKARIGTQAANAAAAFLNYLPFVFCIIRTGGI
jgi:glutamine synthetase adenylyltransferase